MTVSTTTNRASYPGDGIQDTFAYAFKIFADADLTVIIRDANGNETTKTLTTHYTVTGAGTNSGGNVVFTAGNIPTATETVVILRELDITQSTDYVANDPFPAESHEDALDRLTMIAQQLSEETGRSLKLSQTNEIATAEFTTGAADRANKILGFDTNGDLAIFQEIGTFKGTDATTTTADYVERDIVKSTTAAQLDNVYIALQNSPTGTLLTNTTYWALLVDAVTAATSATNAANSATSAQTAQTAAETAQTAAETAQTGAETAYDDFDDRYLGELSSDPLTDNDGDALITGALYFNSTDGDMRVYNGSAWINVVSSLGNLANIVEDSTPQLGGDLASNGQDILMADDDAVIIGTDTDLTIVHDSGVNNTLFKSDTLEFKSKANANLTFKIAPGATKAAVLYYQGSERLAIESGTSRFTGGINADTATIASLAYPTSDGTNGQVLTTNGSGTLSFQDVTETDPSALAFAIALG